MCWRGHLDKHHYVGPDGKRYCRRCHTLRARHLRHPDYPISQRRLYLLKRDEFESAKRLHGMTDGTVALGAGISRSVIRDYKRRVRRQPYRATQVYATRVAAALGCAIDQLWSEA